MKFNSLYLLFLLSWMMCGCKIFHHPADPTGFNIEPGTKSFVVIDAGITYTPGLAIKKRRKGVIKEVKNQYLVTLTRVLQKQLRLNSLTDSTLTADERNKLAKKDPALMASLSKKYNTAIVLILKDCFSGFTHSNVKKIASPDGRSTSKIAEYTVFFDTDWIILQGDTINEKMVSASKFHSLGIIQSEFLDRGPGYSSNKNDIQEMAEKNALNVALLFKY